VIYGTAALVTRCAEAGDEELRVTVAAVVDRTAG
jgi:hypothetical protein